MLDQGLKVISSFEQPLLDCPLTLGSYEPLLTELDPIVQRSSQDEHYRQSLSSSRELWERLKEILQNVSNLSHKMGIRLVYLRCVRGLFLLMRNLSVSNQDIAQSMLLQSIAVRAFLHITKGCTLYDKMETSLYVVVASFLHNITKKSVISDDETLKSFDAFLKYPLHHSKIPEELLFPYSLLFLNLTASDYFLHHFLKQQGQDDILYEFFVKELVEHHTELFKHVESTTHTDGKYEIGTLDAIFLKIFVKIVTSGSFGPFLQNASKNGNDKLFRILKLSQLVVTSSENWDKFELTGIMSWCFPIMEQSAISVKEYFQNRYEDVYKAQVLHAKLNISLDILSILSKYEHVRQYILSYGGLQTLISLLRVLQDNLIRINFYRSPDGSIKSIKASDSKGEKINDQYLLSRRIDLTHNQIMATNFPESKSFIMEIMTSLTYENLSVQDKIRELDGLQLIISNCMIDDNDPFIKERSIICIKFLLKNNKANQDFVANLEAQKAVQDETLAEVGYEIRIGENGKVRLAPKKTL